MFIARWLMIVAVCLTLIGLATSMSPAQTASRADPILDAVRAELLERLNTSSSPVRATVIDASTLKAEGPEKTELTISLDNLTAEVRTKPEQLKFLIDRFARMVELSISKSANPNQSEMTKEQFVASLRPVIRHKDYLVATTSAASKGPGFEILWRPVVGDVIILVAIDNSEHIQMVTRDRAKAHNLDDAAVFQTALENLASLASSVEIRAANQFRIVAVSEEYYSGSMILMPEVMTKLERALGKDFLVMIPDRNTLIAAAAKDAAAMTGLQAHLAKERKAQPLIPHLLQRSGADWKIAAKR
jgi:uncharacterized protein YtpQ (UPF0354 family)